VGLVSKAKKAIREEAAAGAREAMMPWVLLALLMSAAALTRGRR
jgi:hypothetical protein